MTGQIPREQVPGEQVPGDALQMAPFPITVTAVRREVTCALIPEWVRATRSPLETLTWQPPLAVTDDAAEEHG
ncbi:hypothetical protein ACIQVK_19120 [Streptomyces sp. NPDC090493]|uniref:hypothetical protein n=1 Tax=Streptomyces sp. NPDC090493 TaxID=3365964 RepID=UPI0037FA0269